MGVLPRPQSGSLYQGGELSLRLMASSLHAHLSPQRDAEKKHRLDKLKSPKQLVNLSLLCMPWLLSSCRWFRGLEKQALGSRNPLSPTNVWLPSDQTHHRLAANDSNPPNNSSCYLLLPEVWESLFISGFD